MGYEMDQRISSLVYCSAFNENRDFLWIINPAHFRNTYLLDNLHEKENVLQFTEFII